MGGYTNTADVVASGVLAVGTGNPLAYVSRIYCRSSEDDEAEKERYFRGHELED